MCGIFGLIASNESSYKQNFLSNSFTKLACLSETRGKDSSGICTFNPISNNIDILKGPIPMQKLIKTSVFKKKLSDSFKQKDNIQCAFGHSRLVTNGSQLSDINNQPVFSSGLVGVHNGIIANDEELWAKYPDISRKSEIDTEILLALIRQELIKEESLESAISNSIKQIKGTVSLAFVLDDYSAFALATNNGSLYTLTNGKDILYFASEFHIINELQKKIDFKKINDFEIKQVKSDTGIIINYKDFSLNNFSFSDAAFDSSIVKNDTKSLVNINTIKSSRDELSVVIDLNKIHLNSKSSNEKLSLEYNLEKIKCLKRCSKCILPYTFPFITFNDDGVCNYCDNYKKKNKSSSLEELLELVEPYRKNKNIPDVLIPLSGGRDSIYTLHVIKNDLKMNPITYTYDWGMVTDLARRNIARACGKLKVENIIVAADIHWKRENIRKNIIAWLKNPSLGMIPLFMAGDKFFFYHAYRIKKQLGIDLEIWGVNDLENTNFKTGFAGLEPQFNKKHIYSLSINNQLKLFSFVGKNIFRSPGYLNQSIFDSLGSYGSRYIIPKKNYYHMFDYIEWNEENIENTIINDYDWEKAIDTNSTWRIGDGTASFYNYVYTLVAGFSENDTFRSNQIREGMLTRDRALELVYEENEPRYNSLKWYLEIVGLDFMDTIARINKLKRLY